MENNPACVGFGGNADVCPPRRFNDLNDSVYLSNGDGTFRDASDSVGLASGGKGLGVVLADFDDDDDIDIYVANDTTNNFLYVNNGSGVFEERGIPSGTAVDDRANANGSMGLAVFDYNGDSISDIWVTNYEGEVSALYQGAPGMNFQHVSTRVGMQSLGNLYVGFGCVAADLDLDGDEDIAIANGHAVRFPNNAPTLQKPLILENLAGDKLEKFNPEKGTYLDSAALGRGLVSVDYNNDALPDLLFVNLKRSPTFVKNVSATEGRSLRLQLFGRESNRTSIGTRIQLKDKNGLRQITRWVCGGGSYLSSGSPEVHFGIPTDFEFNSVEIKWPSGHLSVVNSEDFGDRFLLDKRIVVVEPRFDTLPHIHPIE